MNGAGCKTIESSAETPLVAAIQSCDGAVIARLLSLGANANDLDALYASVISGDAAVVEALVAAGAFGVVLSLTSKLPHFGRTGWYALDRRRYCA